MGQPSPSEHFELFYEAFHYENEIFCNVNSFRFVSFHDIIVFVLRYKVAAKLSRIAGGEAESRKHF